MNIRAATITQRPLAAFTLVEIMVAVAVIGISFAALYSGITAGVQVVRLARENLRATQVLVEKMETVRLNTWDQVTSGTNLPPTFTETFYPSSTNSPGITYYGTVTVTNAGLSANYNSNLCEVIMQLRWTNCNVPRMREIHTYVARDGMQNYFW